ncbi:MAG: hypothetical protein QOF58_6165 [Pseudonocardiales bacterium]|nr:hypothetical protein [Pseudonocardiales bacterium]
MFEPIAIVGRGAVLPDALGPDAFWDNVKAGRDSLSHVPDGRWRCASPEGAWHDIGGYVRGFDLDASGFAIDVRGLDQQFLWVLHAVRQALTEARVAGRKTGLVLGNLSFPTMGMAEYAEQVWRKGPRPDARNRFMSGLPAHLAAKALGLENGFALDAACASSLYAIKLACDQLHDRKADVMVAGAVNCADDLFIHTGFSALSALSRSGRSRPFHRDADGLIPAEGAAFVSLMRLADVGDREVLGVIRGVGLSNDGRGAGMLVPSAEGQERAMRLAYEMAGIAPETVSLLECHATGTQVGDAVEVRSSALVFAGHSGLPIGSVKSNVGHLVTAAGVAGVLKVLGAMKDGIRPATLHADTTIEALDGTPLRVLTEAEEWTGPKRAAVSAFGFGGNNAHLIIDAPDLHEGSFAQPQVHESSPHKDQVAIVAVVAPDPFSGVKAGKRERVDIALQG